MEPAGASPSPSNVAQAFSKQVERRTADYRFDRAQLPAHPPHVYPSFVGLLTDGTVDATHTDSMTAPASGFSVVPEDGRAPPRIFSMQEFSALMRSSDEAFLARSAPRSQTETRELLAGPDGASPFRPDVLYLAVDELLASHYKSLPNYSTAQDLPKANRECEVVTKAHLTYVVGHVPGAEGHPCAAGGDCCFSALARQRHHPVDPEGEVCGAVYRTMKDVQARRFPSGGLCLMCILYAVHTKVQSQDVRGVFLNPFRVRFDQAGEFCREDVILDVPGLFGAFPVYSSTQWMPVAYTHPSGARAPAFYLNVRDFP